MNKDKPAVATSFATSREWWLDISQTSYMVRECKIWNIKLSLQFLWCPQLTLIPFNSSIEYPARWLGDCLMLIMGDHEAANFHYLRWSWPKDYDQEKPAIREIPEIHTIYSHHSQRSRKYQTSNVCQVKMDPRPTPPFSPRWPWQFQRLWRSQGLLPSSGRRWEMDVCSGAWCETAVSNGMVVATPKDLTHPKSVPLRGSRGGSMQCWVSPGKLGESPNQSVRPETDSNPSRRDKHANLKLTHSPKRVARGESQWELVFSSESSLKPGGLCSIGHIELKLSVKW